MDPLTRAAWRRRLQVRPALQVANGTTAMTLPVPDGSAADAVKAAWLPVRAGQAVPLLGERRWVDPTLDDD